MTPANLRRGIIVACDVVDEQALDRLVACTASCECIAAYKLGAMLGLKLGIARACAVVRQHGKQAIVYDHQKFGTDIPEVCGGQVLDTLLEAGVSRVIAFPFAGPDSLNAFVDGCRKRAIEPIVGGEMTHKGFLAQEGGYLAGDAPKRIYSDAANLGVKSFVIPGTKVEAMALYCEAISRVVPSAAFYFPGIGKGQGGDIVAAFQAVANNVAFAIVGRGIYSAADPKWAAEGMWKTVSDAGLDRIRL